MISDPQEKQLPAKQGRATNDKARTSMGLWSGLKDPRIVRVSRAFGGKDRHSKVSTIRGLRDRRVRLSVPTAIQLYDLQDRLGLNQPSKAVDWLLDAARHEIDKLPPLQMPPGNFIQFPQALQMSHEATPRLQAPSCPSGVVTLDQYPTANGVRPLALFSSKGNQNVLGNEVVLEDLDTLSKSNRCHSHVLQKTKQRQATRESGIEEGNAIEGNEMEHDASAHCGQVSANDLLSRTHHPSLDLLSNAMQYTCYYQWESADAYNVSHLGIHSSPAEGQPTSHSSSLSSPPASQLVLRPSGAMTSVFDFDPKQFSHFQGISSASENTPLNPTRAYLHSGNPAMRPFQSYLASKHHHAENQNKS